MKNRKSVIFYVMIILIILVLIEMIFFGIFYFRKHIKSNSDVDEITKNSNLAEETIPHYVFVSGKYTWEEAKAKCEAIGGNLATVHSDAEWNAVLQTAVNAKNQNAELEYIWMGSTTLTEPNLMLSLDSASGNWTLNDVSNQLDNPDFNNSNMGYIVEFPANAPLPSVKMIAKPLSTEEATEPVTEAPPTEPPATQSPPVQPAVTKPAVTEPPFISGEISVKSGEWEAGTYYTFTLSVKGNYDYYWITCDYYGYNGDGIAFARKETSSSVTLMQSGDVYKVVAHLTPYYNSGTSGKEITSTYELKWEEPIEEVYIYPCFGLGHINHKGVSGFTSSYVVNHGSKTTVRDTLGYQWHVTTSSYCNSMGITWYELYDADDGDYYGWVDGTYVDFYQLSFGP